MANRKNCIHQGFAIKPEGQQSKKVVICCDYDGKIHNKKYCLSCDFYKPKEKDNGL